MADSYLGEIRAVGFNFAPSGWALCDGSSRPVSGNERLYDLIGTTFGGSGEAFNLPDLRSRIPLAAGQGQGLSNRTLGEVGGEEQVTLTQAQLGEHTHELAVSKAAEYETSPDGALLGESRSIDLYRAGSDPKTPMNDAAVTAAGSGLPHQNIQPYLVLNYVISLEGDLPTGPNTDPDLEPFLGEIRLMAAGQAPSDWAQCAGQQMTVSQNAALFSLLATTFGGNGTTTFGLPDLRGRVPMDWGQGPGLSDRFLGEVDGSESVTIQVDQMPPHTHPFNASNLPADKRAPDPGNALGRSGSGNAYQSDTGALVRTAADALSVAGGGQPHTNLQPYLALDYYICLQGLFPSRG